MMSSLPSMQSVRGLELPRTRLQVMPSPSFSAAECVEIQLEALIRNDDPWCGVVTEKG